MKKLFIAALAMAAFTACSQDELVEQQQQKSGAIAFSSAFVNNATRAAADPSTTTGSIKNFDVWGFVENVTGTVFNDEDVVKNGDGWTYANTQYWSNDKSYYFYALSPMNSANVTETLAVNDASAKKGLGSVKFVNIDGSEDLLYATKAVANVNPTTQGPVELEFNHLLSKVKFTFINGFINENTELVVRDIEMVAPNQGTIDLTQNDYAWTLDGTTTLSLAFGDAPRLVKGGKDECATERLTIPAAANQEYTVTFTVDLYQGEVLAETFKDVTTVVSGVALEIGKAYNFTATLNGTSLNLNPIIFEVNEVKDWVIADNVLETPQNLTIENETMTLVSNGVINGAVFVKNGVLDGAGHTLEAAVSPSDNGLLRPEGNTTVKNLTIDGKGYKTTSNKNLRAFYITKNGVYNIDNVTTTGTGYALNIQTATNVTLNVTNSTLEGWLSYNSITVASFTNVNFTKGQYQYIEGDDFSNGYFRPYGTTTLTNCKFEEGYTIDFTELASGKTVTFDNCYYGDDLITAEFVLANPTNFTGYEASKCVFLPHLVNASVAAGETLILTSDNVIEGTLAVAGVLDGAGHTISAQVSPSDNGLVRPEGEATVKNLTIDGKGYKTTSNKNLRAFYITKNGVYNIDNVTTTGTGYALNIQTATDVTLNVANSTLEGWLSYNTITVASFTNVKFTRGQYEYIEGNQFSNGYFRPYGTTTLSNCNFESGYTIDFNELGSGKTVKFVNCYVNGTKITADNIKTLLTIEDNTVPASVTIE